MIYLDLEGLAKTYLIWIYAKGSKEDLEANEKKIIRELVSLIQKEVR